MRCAARERGRVTPARVLRKVAREAKAARASDRDVDVQHRLDKQVFAPRLNLLLLLCIQPVIECSKTDL